MVLVNARAARIVLGKNTLTLPLALLALLAGLIAWLDQTVRAPENATRGQKVEPETIVENFRALETGVDGQIRYRLEARTLRHFGDDRPTTLDTPRVSQVTGDGTRYRAGARHATLSADARTVTLDGAAYVDSHDAQNRPAFLLRSERLVLEPERNTITAPGPSPATVRAPGWNARATTLEWQGQTRVLQLKGRVRAEYRHAAS